VCTHIGGFFFNFFFLWQNSVKFRPEKYDFDLYNGFSMKKTSPKFTRFGRIFFQFVRIFNDKFQEVAKNLEGFCFLFFYLYKFNNNFLISYLVCNQIWLNHRMDARHFTNITNFFKKKTPSNMEEHGAYSIGNKSSCRSSDIIKSISKHNELFQRSEHLFCPLEADVIGESY
jgi:hypothetical protein